MGFMIGKALQIAAMLTLGVALVEYGFIEENMNAELGWLVVGIIVFMLGYALERRSGGGR